MRLGISDSDSNRRWGARDSRMESGVECIWTHTSRGRRARRGESGGGGRVIPGQELEGHRVPNVGVDLSGAESEGIIGANADEEVGSKYDGGKGETGGDERDEAHIR